MVLLKLFNLNFMKKGKVKVKKTAVVLSSTLDTRLKGFKFSFIDLNAFNRALKDLTNNENIFNEKILYLIKVNGRTLLVDNKLNLIEQSFQHGGFPIELYEKNTEGSAVLCGFTFLPLKELEYLYWENPDFDSHKDMHDLYSSNEHEDILFNLMLHKI